MSGGGAGNELQVQLGVCNNGSSGKEAGGPG